MIIFSDSKIMDSFITQLSCWQKLTYIIDVMWFPYLKRRQVSFNFEGPRDNLLDDRTEWLRHWTDKFNWSSIHTIKMQLPTTALINSINTSQTRDIKLVWNRTTENMCVCLMVLFSFVILFSNPNHPLNLMVKKNQDYTNLSYLIIFSHFLDSWLPYLFIISSLFLLSVF